MRHSLKNALIVPLMVSFLVLGIATYWVLGSQIHSRLQAEFDQALLTRAQVMITLTSFEEADPEEDEHVPYVEFEFSSDFMPEFALDEGGSYFQLWLPEEELARSESLGEGDLLRPETADGNYLVQDVLLPDGREGRMLTRRFMPQFDEDWGEGVDEQHANLASRYPGLQLPLITLTVAVGREGLDETMAFINWVLGGGLLILMLIVGTVARIATNRGLKPLNELVGQLGGINSEKLDARVNQEGLPDEVAPLARTMNSLLDRLEKSFQKERQFSRNIAHELRTPIAELRSIGEVGEQWPDDPETNLQFFNDILQIGNRMDLMVTNLLTMARQESGQIQCAWESLDLTNSIQGVKKRFRGECEENGLIMALHGDAVSVQADRIYLDIITANLLSNAVHHGRGNIDVHVYSDGARAGFVVENPVDLLSQDDMPHLFDRFWRKEPARTSGRHAGLGLALVKSLSEVCDWSVNAELSRQNILRVRVDGIRRS